MLVDLSFKSLILKQITVFLRRPDECAGELCISELFGDDVCYGGVEKKSSLTRGQAGEVINNILSVYLLLKRYLV